MKNLKIGTRLTLAFSCIIVMLLIITAVGVNRLGSLNESQSLLVNDRFPKVMKSSEALDGIKDMSISVRNLLILNDPALVQDEFARIDQRAKMVTEALRFVESRVTTEKGRQVFAILNGIKSHDDDNRARFIDMIRDGNKAEAASFLLLKMKNDQEKYFEQVLTLVGIGGKLMIKSGMEAEENFHDSRLLTVSLSMISLVLAAALTYLIKRSITVPLQQAVEIADTIAKGNLSTHIASNRDDETGQLMRSLQVMNASLARIVGDVRSGADALAQATCEIASGTMDLSTRTEEQAVALGNTAASMKELTSTVRENASSAQKANRLVKSAARIAATGGDEVNNVIERMSAINESSRKINDIIGVIDGIAFQTNILALNAAVEAARAGEQGRGFAVVASEVRSLAQRSAAAAKEIKALIQDTNTKVEAGNEFASRVGTTMQNIVNEIEHVATLMSSIDQASQGQAADIEQVNVAVAQMDQVTQQNAALVEEAAAAAESMHSRTDELNSAVSVFILAKTIAPNSHMVGVNHDHQAPRISGVLSPL